MRNDVLYTLKEKKIEEMALQEQLKQSKAINEQLNQTVRRLRIQLQVTIHLILLVDIQKHECASMNMIG